MAACTGKLRKPLTGPVAAGWQGAGRRGRAPTRACHHPPLAISSCATGCRRTGPRLLTLPCERRPSQPVRAWAGNGERRARRMWLRAACTRGRPLTVGGWAAALPKKQKRRATHEDSHARCAGSAGGRARLRRWHARTPGPSGRGVADTARKAPAAVHRATRCVYGVGKHAGVDRGISRRALPSPWLASRVWRVPPPPLPPSGIPGAVSVHFKDVGSLRRQKELLRELISLPLLRPDIFAKVRGRRKATDGRVGPGATHSRCCPHARKRRRTVDRASCAIL